MRRSGVLAALLVLWVAAAGCSHMDFDMETDLPRSETAGLTGGKSRAQIRMERLAEALAAWEADHGQRDTDYRLGPGDELEVSIFALEEPDESALLERPVSRRGYITLPYVGSIAVAGLSAWEAEERVKEAYAGRYIKDPQVMVGVADYVSAAVVVTGAVSQPGVYHLKHNASSVLEMLSEAGGLTEEAGDDLLIVRGQRDADVEGQPDGEAAAPRTAVVDLVQLLDEGKLTQNLEVNGGDILSVPPRQAQYVYVLGYVARPGAYELKDGMRIDAMRAVALGGGLTSTARAKNSFLLRETADGQKVYPLDLRKVASAEPPLYMQPGDTLIVGTSFMARVSEFLRPSMGASVSASASVMP